MTVSRASRELLRLEQRSKVSLDDDSARLLARLRSRRVLGDRDWKTLLGNYADALQYLVARTAVAAQKDQAETAVQLDSDPRNADWLRIVRACKLAGFRLPSWAAWWLKMDKDPRFWPRVGEIARSLGYPPWNSD